MSALSALVIPAIVSAIVTLIMTILLDRWYGFFHKNKIIREIEDNRPLINCQLCKKTKKIVIDEFPLYFVHLLDINDQGRTGLYLEQISTNGDTYKVDNSYFLFKIVNNTPHGATITAIYGVNDEKLNIASGLENVYIYPQKSITIYANATPQPITAIQLGYCDYNLLFKIEKSSTGFIIPKITKLKNK